MRFRNLLTDNEALQLESLTGEIGLDGLVPDVDAASPGLARAGYTSCQTPTSRRMDGLPGA